jgi:hypothetical protein
VPARTSAPTRFAKGDEDAMIVNPFRRHEMKHVDVEAPPQVSQTKLDLIAAKALINTPEKWCQRRMFDVSSTWQQQACSRGALIRIIGINIIAPLANSRLSMSINALTKVMGNVGEYNDSHTHAEVMAMWDKAIAEA